MGTTALTLLQSRFRGWFALLYSNMKCFVLSSLLSLSLAAPAPEAAADAALIHPLIVHHAAPFAVVPAKQLQWPGVSAPGLDATCFGCRSHVVVPAGRKRRSAEAEAVADATPEAEAVADAEAAPVAEAVAEAAPVAEAVAEAAPVVVPAPALTLNGYAHNLGSGNSFAAISSSPSLHYGYGLPAFPAAYGYGHHYPYLG